MTPEGERIVTCGASGGGKTLRVRLAVQKSPRLSVFDPKMRWAVLDRCKPCYTRAEFMAAIKAAGPRPARLAFCRQSPEDFEWWAQATAGWGVWGHQSGVMLDAVAEELATVTSSGKAPPQYQALVATYSRDFGINVHALIQRPAEGEKTTIGNVSVLRAFFMPKPKDRKYIADELDCDPRQLATLSFEWGEYLERNTRGGTLKKYRCSVKLDPMARAKIGGTLPKWKPVPL